MSSNARTASPEKARQAVLYAQEQRLALRERAAGIVAYGNSQLVGAVRAAKRDGVEYAESARACGMRRQSLHDLMQRSD